MSNATFHNFTDKPFTFWWNGKPKTVKAGERIYMPAYLAEHAAKHLTNQVLMDIPGGKGENYTSPKYPSQVPQFMEIFNKAFIPDTETEGNELEQEIASVQKDPSSSIEVTPAQPLNSSSPAAAQAAGDVGPGKEAQIISPPAGDDDEEGFAHEGKQ